jgi:uncharacterized damage-inducible protein DinB
MMIIPALLAELDRELAVTRRLLERVPDAEAAWRPHERSFSLGELAAHLVHVLGYAKNLLTEPGYDLLASTGKGTRAYATREALLEAFDRRAASARQLLATRSDADLHGSWQLSRGREEVFTAPRGLVLRRFLFNHLVHHRGQLTIYLRMRGVDLPAIYGPSSDEDAT